MHKLAKLLGEAEVKITGQIDRFEAACGYPGQDVRLLGENIQEARRKVTELGLDPDDTTAEELYQALINRYENDNRRLESDFGIDNVDEATQKSRAVELAWHCLADQQTWSLKPFVVKAALKELPPTKTRKLLGYRSVTSMLKRSDVSLVLAVAHQTESESWQQSWQRLVKKMPATAYGMRPVKLLSAPVGLNQGTVAVTTEVTELGSIIIWPSGSEPNNTIGRVLQILMATQHLTGQSWSRELGKLHPAMQWWSSNDHLVAWFDDEPVSFNICDVSKSAGEQAQFVQRSSVHAGQSLWRKLLDGYQKLASELPGKEAETSSGNQFLPEFAAMEFDDD